MFTVKVSESNEWPKSFRVAEWLSSDHSVLHRWMKDLISHVEHNEKPLIPVIQKFKELIENDSELYMLFHLMFREVPHKYKNDPVGSHQVIHYSMMLKMLNHIMTEAPVYNSSGLVGFPINALFDYSMGTTAGFAAFLDVRVNQQLKIVLSEWAIYLSSADSCKVLTNDEHNGSQLRTSIPLIELTSSFMTYSSK